MRDSRVCERLEPLILAGAVATCATPESEALQRARGDGQNEQIRADRRAALEYLPTEDEHWRAALGAQ